MSDKPHLRVIDSARQQQELEEKKKNDYKKRGNSQKEFYKQARINEVALDRLKEALRSSVVIDPNTNEVLVRWTDEMIESLIADIEDPGPKREQRIKD